MAQTSDLFVQTPLITLECKKGETVPFKALLFPGKDLSKIYQVLASGCPCTKDFMVFNDRIEGIYQDSHTEQYFKEQGDPSFIFIERHFAVWYNKEGVTPEVVGDRGGLVINHELPWESVTLSIKVINK